MEGGNVEPLLRLNLGRGNLVKSSVDTRAVSSSGHMSGPDMSTFSIFVLLVTVPKDWLRAQRWENYMNRIMGFQLQ